MNGDQSGELLTRDKSLLFVFYITKRSGLRYPGLL